MKIRTYRETFGYTQIELAKLWGVSQSTLSRIEDCSRNCSQSMAAHIIARSHGKIRLGDLPMLSQRREAAKRLQAKAG